jgi:hypothetical protein
MPKRFSERGGRTFVVCDALDEVDEFARREVFLPLFHEMETEGFEMFLTSRHHPADVRESFSEAIQLDIHPPQDRLENYIRPKLAASTKFTAAIRKSNSLKLDIINIQSHAARVECKCDSSSIIS